MAHRQQKEPWHKKYQVDVPEGTLGSAEVDRINVVDTEMLRLSNFMDMARSLRDTGFARGSIPPGSYTRLITGDMLMMSDTPDEIGDLMPIIRRAEKHGGHALITGLGIGVVLQAVLAFENVEKATVIEIDEDVVKLVGPHYKKKFGSRFDLICADALEWEPPEGTKFTIAWHDIWPTISSENWPDMIRLREKYADFVKEWQGCWCQENTYWHRYGCENCNGSGVMDCYDCDGTGETMHEECGGDGCDECHDSGYTICEGMDCEEGTVNCDYCDRARVEYSAFDDEFFVDPDDFEELWRN